MTSSLGTDYTLIPNQRYRRSCRHSSKVSNTQDTESSSQSTLGNFKTLPLEIFHMVLQYLPVKDISKLSMVSKTLGSRLINYISTPTGNKRLLVQNFHNSEFFVCRMGISILEHYRCLGLLLKRCTFLLPTKERLKYIQKIFAEVSCFKLIGCVDPLHCSGLLCYGVFLQTLTAGWDELECHRVYNFLCEMNNLLRRVQTVVSSKPGHVVWHKMIDGPTDETSLKGLAEAIKLLYDIEAKEWTADDVISLLDELSVPREWLLENSARLLILCGNNICFTFMASKAVNGRAIELARLVVFLALVCEKDLYCMDWAVKMMQKVCKVFSTPSERNNFLQSVENAFAQIIMEALQMVISGVHEEEDSSFLNLFHLVNAQANFHKEILYLTMDNSL